MKLFRIYGALFGAFLSVSASAQTIAPPAGAVPMPNQPTSAPVVGTDPNGNSLATPVQGQGANVLTIDPTTPLVAGDSLSVGSDGATAVDSGNPANVSGLISALEPPLTIADFGDTDAANAAQNYWTNPANGVPTQIHLLTSARSVATWAAAFLGGQIAVDQTDPINAPTNGLVTGYWVQFGGSGYTAPTLTVPDCPGATATATVTSGGITGVTIGTANTTACADGIHAVTITDSGTPTGAKIWANVPDINGGVNQYYVQSGGSGYSASSNVTATNSICPGAVPGAVTVVNGAITAVGSGTPGTAACNPAQGYLTFTDTGGTPTSNAMVQITSSQGGTFGGIGEDSNQILARVGDVTSSNAGVIVLHCCTEDSQRTGAVAISPLQTQNNLKQIIKAITSAGKIVVLMNDSPRLVCSTASTGTPTNTNTWCAEPLTSAQQLINQQQDLFKSRYPLTQQTVFSGNNNNVLYLNCANEFTNTDGTPVVGVKYDNEHLSNGGAETCGYKLAQLLSVRLGLPMGLAGLSSSASPLDTYDVTNNPTGIINPNFTLAGTGGTVPSGCSGSVATGWVLAVSDAGTAGTWTCTVTASARSDGLPGTSQKLTATNTATGTGNVRRWTFTQNGTAAGWNVNPGDVIQPSVMFLGSNTTKASMVDFRFQCVQAASPYNVTAYDEWGGNSGDWYPDGSSSQPGALTTAKPFLAVGAPITIPPECTDNVNFNILVSIDGSQTGAQGTVEFINPTLRKLEVSTIAACEGTACGCTGTSCNTTGGGGCTGTSCGGTSPGITTTCSTTGSAGYQPASGGTDWTLKFCDDFQGNNWAASTNYAVNQEVLNGSGVYAVDTAGTSAASGGPTGTSQTTNAITDNTVKWHYVGTTSSAAFTGVNEDQWSYLFNGKPNNGAACMWNTFTDTPSSSQGSAGTVVNVSNLKPYVQHAGVPGTYTGTASVHNIDVGYGVTDITHPGYIPNGTTVSAVGGRSGASTFTMSNASTTAIPSTDLLRFTSPGPQAVTVGPVTLNGVTQSLLTLTFSAYTSANCGYSPEYGYGAGSYTVLGGMLNARNSFQPTYGYVESSAQTSASGVDGRDEGSIIFYDLGENGITEFDPGEMLSKEPAQEHSTVHWGATQSGTAPKAGKVQYATYYCLQSNCDATTGNTFASAFHVYGLDWEPTFVAMYVDGSQKFRITRNSNNTTYTTVDQNGTTKSGISNPYIYTSWVANTSYSSGTFFVNGGRIYEVDTAGTSGGTGPTSTSAASGGVTDGSAKEQYIGQIGPVPTLALEMMVAPDTCHGTGSDWCNGPPSLGALYPYKFYVKYVHYWQHTGQTFVKNNN